MEKQASQSDEVQTVREQRRRIRDAKAALKAYPGVDKYDLRSSLVDLVADLCHLADSKDQQDGHGEYNVERLLESALMHFRAERRTSN